MWCFFSSILLTKKNGFTKKGAGLGTEWRQLPCFDAFISARAMAKQTTGF
jgi:hypothetical protein